MPIQPIWFALASASASVEKTSFSISSLNSSKSYASLPSSSASSPSAGAISVEPNGKRLAAINTSSPPLIGSSPNLSLASFLLIMPSLTACVTFSYIIFLRSVIAGIASKSYLIFMSSPNNGLIHSFISLSIRFARGIIVSSYRANLASCTLEYVWASGIPISWLGTPKQSAMSLAATCLLCK